MRHPFFSVINWDALYRMEVAPPFDPCKNQDVEDAKNFESDFTNMPLFSVDDEGASGRGDRVSDTFQNFTYEEESAMGKGSPPATAGSKNDGDRSPSSKGTPKAEAGSSWEFSLFGKKK